MCDCLVALSSATDGPTLFAKNSDRPAHEEQVVHWSPPRIDTGPLSTTHVAIEPQYGPTFGAVLCRPAWCWGAEHGVNTAGVAIGNEAIYTTRDPRGVPPALIGMDLVRLGLERAGTAAAAVDVIVALLRRYGQGGSGHDPVAVPAGRPYWSSFLVADPHRAFVVETSGDEYAVEAVADVRAISNRTTIPGFDERHRHPRQPVEQRVDPRWRASNDVLARRPVTVDALATHLRSHDSCGESGWSVCMHVDGVETTASSMIAELAPDGGPHRAWMLVGSPCEQRYTAFDLGLSAGGTAERLSG
ncbi:MAG: hypothetical protein ABIR68_12935 [Ilumatobacteraceae bacterium]